MNLALIIPSFIAGELAFGVVLGKMMKGRSVDSESHQALLNPPTSWPAPPAPAPPAVEPVVGGSVDHLGEALALLGKAIDALAPQYAAAGMLELPAQMARPNPANIDWDPTDDTDWLADPEFGAMVPDRPQVGDAPDLATNPFGVPGLSWPPAPADVVS